MSEALITGLTCMLCLPCVNPPRPPAGEFSHEVESLFARQGRQLPEDAARWIGRGLDATKRQRTAEAINFLKQAYQALDQVSYGHLEPSGPIDKYRDVQALSYLAAMIGASKARVPRKTVTGYGTAVYWFETALRDLKDVDDRPPSRSRRAQGLELPLLVHNKMRMYHAESIVHSVRITDSTYPKRSPLALVGRSPYYPGARPSEWIRSLYDAWKRNTPDLQEQHPDVWSRDMRRWIKMHTEVARRIKKKIKDVEVSLKPIWKEEAQGVLRLGKKIRDERNSARANKTP